MNATKILSFLSELKQNNNRDWFQNNKDRFEESKSQLMEITNYLIASVSRYDNQVLGLEAKDCLFRIYRDVRFSKDKLPYKTNMGTYLAKGGRKSAYAGYYLHLEPGDNSFVAGGMHCPTTDVLAKVREDIDYHFDDFKAVINAKEFYDYYGELGQDNKLKRPPKGYSADNPAVEYLKLKSVISFRKLTDHELSDGKFVDIVLDGFQKLYPLNQFLNRVL
ncbi:MAG: DUF2461 domain-containing protein [Bacteroidales bacterium]|nr:DUF2461 domain-containing protein [Bacteroidales bacterium]